MSSSANLEGTPIEGIKEWESYYESNKSEPARNNLIIMYRPKVTKEAGRIYKNLPRKFDEQDLISEGTLGLIKAINEYDPKKGYKPTTYFTPKIKGAMRDFLRRSDWVPRAIRNIERDYNEAKNKLFTELKRSPHDYEIADAMELSMKEYIKIERHFNPSGLTSINDYVTGEDDSSCSIKNPKAPEPWVSIQQRESFRKLTQEFDRDEKLILQCLYESGLDMIEIGGAVGVSNSRIGQMHKSLIQRLKAKAERK